MDDSEIRKLVGIRMRAVRHARHYKRETVCEIIGISREQLSYYEAGKSEVPSASLFKIAVHFGVTMDYFYFGFSRYTEADVEEILDTQREKRSEIIKLMDRKAYRTEEQYRMVKNLVENMSSLDESKDAAE